MFVNGKELIILEVNFLGHYDLSLEVCICHVRVHANLGRKIHQGLECGDLLSNSVLGISFYIVEKSEESAEKFEIDILELQLGFGVFSWVKHLNFFPLDCYTMKMGQLPSESGRSR